MERPAVSGTSRYTTWVMLGCRIDSPNPNNAYQEFDLKEPVEILLEEGEAGAIKLPTLTAPFEGDAFIDEWVAKLSNTTVTLCATHYAQDKGDTSHHSVIGPDESRLTLFIAGRPSFYEADGSVISVG